MWVIIYEIVQVKQLVMDLSDSRLQNISVLPSYIFSFFIHKGKIWAKNTLS